MQCLFIENCNVIFIFFPRFHVVILLVICCLFALFVMCIMYDQVSKTLSDLLLCQYFNLHYITSEA